MRPYLVRMMQTIILLACFFYIPTAAHAGLVKRQSSVIHFAQNIADTSIKNCQKYEQVEKIITEAISIGAPVYNSGYHLACYRIYEWAGYKILYEYGDSCKEIQKIIKTAIVKSHGDFSDLEKAWIMRGAFDKVLGVPTQTVDPEKKADAGRKG